jgi:hypothetical protein
MGLIGSGYGAVSTYSKLHETEMKYVAYLLRFVVKCNFIHQAVK